MTWKKKEGIPYNRPKNTYRILKGEQPKCDFCSELAWYDGLTIRGMWGYMCREHFTGLGVGLGLGKGQEIVVVRGGDVNEN